MLLSKRGALTLLIFFSLPLLHAQNQGNAGGAAGVADPVSLVGLTLDDLIRRFGAPRSVYAARGLEQWQDDVVFVYDQGDFYVYKNRVWQAGFKAARGIKAGDSRAAVSMILGSKAEGRGNSLFCSLDEQSWPLMMRCDFDKDGRVQMIYIYRSDF